MMKYLLFFTVLGFVITNRAQASVDVDDICSKGLYSVHNVSLKDFCNRQGALSSKDLWELHKYFYKTNEFSLSEYLFKMSVLSHSEINYVMQGEAYSDPLSLKYNLRRAKTIFEKVKGPFLTVANFNLARIYYRGGDGVEKNLKKSIGYYIRVLETADSEFDFVNNNYYGQHQAKFEAYSKFTTLRKSRGGHKYFQSIKTFSRYDLAQIYKRSGNLDSFIFYMKLAARDGLLSAQGEIADYYLAEGNFDKGIYWLKLASEGGEIISMSKLGVFHVTKKHGLVNAALGVELLTLAAENGLVVAQENLGVAYILGQGVAKNNRKAFVWYLVPAMNGNLGAKGILNTLSDEFTAKDIEEMKEEAYFLAEKIKNKKENTWGVEVNYGDHFKNHK